MTQNILEADSVYLAYSNRVILSDVYVKAETGKVTGFLGRNGCGKSSLMKVIFGSLKANFQSVRLNKHYQPSLLLVPDAIRYLPQKALFQNILELSRYVHFFKCRLSVLLMNFRFLKSISNKN